VIPCGHVRAFAHHPLTRGVVRVLFGASILLPSLAAAQGSPSPQEPLECKGGLQRSGIFVSTKTPEGLGLIRGRIIIQCDGTQIFADEITWSDTTAWAKGDVLVIQEGLRVSAERVEMDRRTKLGTFFTASGTARLTEQNIETSMFGTMEPEVAFAAAKVQKMGPKTYRLTEGWFTTCMQTPPRWEIVGSQGTITLDERVLLKNAVFRVKGIPVLYFPIIYYPIGEDDRSSGFLLPTYSRSNITGQGISTAYFWAIDRSQDSTFYYDLFSKVQTAKAEYRFKSAPGSDGNASFLVRNEETQFADDGSVQRAGGRSYDIQGWTSQRLGRRYQLFGQVNYVSDIATQQLYQENLYDFSKRDRRLNAALQGNYRFGRLQALFDQHDIYQTDQNGTRIERSGRLPQFNLFVYPRNFSIGGTRVYWGGKAEVIGFERQFNLDDPLTNRNLFRLHVEPNVSATLTTTPYLSVQTQAFWRLTQWSDSQDPLTAQLTGTAISRSLFEFRTDARGPKLVRTFLTPKNGFAESFKHEIEPYVSYSWLSPFDDRNRIFKNDGIDSLASGTARVDYGVRNRVLAKVKRAGGVGGSTEILGVSIGQSYYTDARAAAVDTQYQANTVGQFSNLEIRAITRPSDRWDASFITLLDPKTWEPATYSAGGSFHREMANFSARWTQSRFRLQPTDDHLTMATHWMSTDGSFKTRDGRLGGAYLFDIDVKNRSLLNQRYRFSYNAQCCGFGVEYQITNIESLNQGDKYRRTFNFTFTLAGIGSFSNPMGAFGNNNGR
jgi:LPS-assembly protein